MWRKATIFIAFSLFTRKRKNSLASIATVSPWSIMLPTQHLNQLTPVQLAECFLSKANSSTSQFKFHLKLCQRRKKQQVISKKNKKNKVEQDERWKEREREAYKRYNICAIFQLNFSSFYQHTLSPHHDYQDCRFATVLYYSRALTFLLIYTSDPLLFFPLWISIRWNTSLYIRWKSCHSVNQQASLNSKKKKEENRINTQNEFAPYFFRGTETKIVHNNFRCENCQRKKDC